MIINNNKMSNKVGFVRPGHNYLILLVITKPIILQALPHSTTTRFTVKLYIQ